MCHSLLRHLANIMYDKEEEDSLEQQTYSTAKTMTKNRYIVFDKDPLEPVLNSFHLYVACCSSMRETCSETATSLDNYFRN